MDDPFRTAGLRCRVEDHEPDVRPLDIKRVDRLPRLDLLIANAVAIAVGLHLRHHLRAVEVFAEYHREMVDKGLMKGEIDAVVAGRSILANLVLFFVYRNLFGPMIELDDYDRELDQVIDAIMHGIAMPESCDKK